MGSGLSQPALGGSGPLCLPTSSHLGQSGEVAGLSVQQNYPDCSKVAQHALVLRPSGHFEPDSIIPAKSAQSIDSVIEILHKNLSNLNLHVWLLEPQLSRSRVSLKQWMQKLRLLRGSYAPVPPKD